MAHAPQLSPDASPTPPPASYDVSLHASSPPPLDRRASAALEPPTLDRERRNTVALSLAGLFDDLVTPEVTAAPPRKQRPTPSFFDADDEHEAAAAPTARRTGLRRVLSPGSIVAALAVIGALYIVGYVVSRENPPKPPSDQVTTVAHTR